MNNKPFSEIWITVIILIIIGGGILGWYYSEITKQEEKVISPGKKQLEEEKKMEAEGVTNQKIYRNENFINFKYPSDWKLEERTENEYGRGVLNIDLFSPDYKRAENLEVVKGYTIFIAEERHAYCYFSESTAEQIKSFFCTSPIPIEAMKGPDPECMRNAKTVDIKNGKAVLLIQEGSAMIFGNEGSLYPIGMLPDPRDKESEELFSSFIASFEILPFVSFEAFFFEDLKDGALYQKAFAGLTGDWKYGAFKISNPNVKITARLCGRDVDKVDFYYSLKESPQKWQLIGSGSLPPDSKTDWEIKWENIPNNKEMYILVKIYKNDLEFQSLPDKIFSNY